MPASNKDRALVRVIVNVSDGRSEWNGETDIALRALSRSLDSLGSPLGDVIEKALSARPSPAAPGTAGGLSNRDRAMVRLVTNVADGRSAWDGQTHAALRAVSRSLDTLGTPLGDVLERALSGRPSPAARESATTATAPKPSFTEEADIYMVTSKDIYRSKSGRRCMVVNLETRRTRKVLRGVVCFEEETIAQILAVPDVFRTPFNMTIRTEGGEMRIV